MVMYEKNKNVNMGLLLHSKDNWAKEGSNAKTMGLEELFLSIPCTDLVKSESR